MVGYYITSPSLVDSSQENKFKEDHLGPTRYRGFRIVVVRINPDIFSTVTSTTAGSTFGAAAQLDDKSTTYTVQNHNDSWKNKLRHRKVDEMGQQGKFMRKHIRWDSHDFLDRQLDQPYSNDHCVPQHKWQTQTFLTCNIIHEQDLVAQAIQKSAPNSVSELSMFRLGKGNYRTVWRMDYWVPFSDILEESSTISTSHEMAALKISNYGRDLSERLVERNRVDALVAERLTKSKHVLDIYGYCGNSALYELASGGSMESHLVKGTQKQWSVDRKFHVAYQAALAVADLHTIDGTNQPASVLHGDLDSSQFVSANGGKDYKLNDFNGARMLYMDPGDKQICTVRPSIFDGYYRSPEDYSEKYISEKSDVFSLGNIVYTILVGRAPYSTEATDKDAQKLLLKGQRDALPDEVVRSTDIRVKAMVKAIELCWIHEPTKRASARQVADLLKQTL